MNAAIDHTNQQIVPFVSATSNLVRLNRRWQEQLKAAKERIRQILVSGNYADDKLDYDADDKLDYDAVKLVVVTSINPNNYTSNMPENFGSILPVIAATTVYSTQKCIADEYTLNREQQAAFMIITSHLDGDKRSHTGIFVHIIDKNKSKYHIHR